MISELVKYIEDAKRRGFAVEEVKHHLSNHGWNDYLIDYAVAQCEQRNDRRWLQGSMMAVMLIVFASAGTVWLVHPSISPVSCFLESQTGDVKLFQSLAACCPQIPKYSCSPLSLHPDRPEIRDASGKVVFSPDVGCKTSLGQLLTTNKVLESCGSKNSP